MNETRKLKILVVDDEESIRQIIAKRFMVYGYEVFSAESGNKAIEFLNQNNIDIVISDIKMPDGSGIDVIQHVRLQSWTLPKVFFISGYSSVTIDELYNMGADGFFSKPFDTKMLLNAVRSVTLSTEEKLSIEVTESIAHHFSVDQVDFNAKVSPIKFGRGGFFAKSETFFPKENELIKFDLSTVDGSKLNFVGRARWVRHQSQNNFPAGFGIEIISADNNSKKLFSSWVENSKPVPYIPIA